MLNLFEYRSSADRLADHLPWAALVAPGIILNKDGSFLRVLRFRGPDLESATEAELISACARANNVLKRFGTGWPRWSRPPCGPRDAWSQLRTPIGPITRSAFAGAQGARM